VVEVGIVRLHVVDREIVMRALIGLGVAARIGTQFHVRATLEESGQETRQPIGGNTVRGEQLHRLARHARRTDAVDGPGDRIVGDVQPVDEACADGSFEPLDAAADGRLRQVERRRGAAETSRFYYSEK
jgi:hypothetical protein